MRPVIGLTGDAITAASNVTNMNYADYAPRMIKEAITTNGGTPIILPIAETPTDVSALVDQYVSMVDGIVIQGGPDVDPNLYGEEPIWQIDEVNRTRDDFEIPLIQAMLAANKPIFGICRGIQIINVALDGTLYQDLVTQYPNELIRHTKASPGNMPTHHVDLVANTYLQEMMAVDRSYVNTRHHQGVKTLGNGLRVSATSPDGMIEGIESIDNDLIVGVQWHPENLWPKMPEDLALFANIVERASR